MKLSALTLAGVLTLASQAGAQQAPCSQPSAFNRLLVQNGNIILMRPLTRMNKDSDAILSRDRGTAYFVRLLAAPDPRDTFEGDMTQIMALDLNCDVPRVILAPKGASEPEKNLRGMHDLALSPDGGTLYFRAAAWQTSDAVHALDLTTGAERFISSGNSYFVVKAGQYAGHLAIEKHKYFAAGGSYDHWWLVMPDGKEVGQVAVDRAGAEQALK